MYTFHQKQKGFLIVFTLVFGAIFLTIIGAFLGYVIVQHSEQMHQYNKERALSVAEAGLNYYKWFLAHNPGNTTNGTGVPGPYVGIYEDPEGGPIGEFSLEIASSTACGEVYAVDIVSTGTTYDNPDVGRKVYARYAQPTVAEYAYIINSSVWAGADRTIVGPYHSNGGVRMDGTNNSTVSSGQETWSCTSTFGCSPTGVRDGVFTTTSNPNTDLFSFPSTPINFTGLTVDLSAMQSKAQTGGGLYIGPSGTGKSGYRVVFNAAGTISVYMVDSTTSYYGYTTEDDWQTERHVIATQHLVGTYTIPTSCSVIFVEDKVWLEGVVKGKVTIAAADVDTAGVDRSMILHGNITYADANSGLLAIAEDDMLIGLVVPNTMSLNGIFVAQNGRFGRNRYCETNSGSEGCSNTTRLPGSPTNLRPYAKRSTLTVNGTIVSNGREGTKWTSGGTYVSGFNIRNNSYDRDLVNDPPPLTPEVSDEYEFIEWREMN
jgi:hypothetical protein